VMVGQTVVNGLSAWMSCLLGRLETLGPHCAQLIPQPRRFLRVHKHFLAVELAGQRGGLRTRTQIEYPMISNAGQ